MKDRSPGFLITHIGRVNRKLKSTFKPAFLKIRYFLKRRLDTIADSNLKQNFLNALPFWVGAFITGVVAVIYAKLFHWAELGTLWLFDKNKWLFFIVTPFSFVVSWWLVQKYAPYARGSGIPQVTAGIELATPKKYYLLDKLLSLKIIFIKIVSSLLMVFGGGVIGREGPTIQIAGSIFKKINDYLPGWYPKISKKNMLITGAAAGLAAAFNTPLGGIVFAIEELTTTHFTYFRSALLSGVIIAGLTALNILGPYLYLGYPAVKGVSLWIIFPVLLVALISGYAASLMGKIILYILKRKKSLTTNRSKIAYCILAGLIIAFLGVIISVQSFGSGKHIMVSTLFTDQKYLEWYIPVTRFFGTLVSFTNGASGGIFAPSLAVGASIGSVFSGWFHLTPSNSNLMILCGMVGFLTGITRSPFTSAILVLEMTSSGNIIFYLMMAGLSANLISTLVDKHSFYDHLKVQYIKEIDTHS
jgi:H+/Cl- antiporter ClcA